MIIVDIETSGLNPQIHDILSIGAVSLEDESKTFYRECYIRKNRKIDDFALKVNGFKKEELTYVSGTNKISPNEAYSEFKSWASSLNDFLLGGHNFGQFDYLFLQDACNYGNHNWAFGHRFVDLHSLLYAKFKQSFRADEGYLKLGLKPEPKPHNALVGALWERKAFLKLL